MLGLRIPSRQVRTLKEVIKKQTHHIEVRLSRHMLSRAPVRQIRAAHAPIWELSTELDQVVSANAPCDATCFDAAEHVAHRSMQELQTQLDQLVYSHPNLKSLPAAPSEAPLASFSRALHCPGVHRVPQLVVSVL